jgi:uncharacterized protein (TIGR00304 family)
MVVVKFIKRLLATYMLKRKSALMGAETLHTFGVALIFVGIAIILVAIFLSFLSNVKGEAKAKSGGVIIIGPIPIVFGTDKESIEEIILLSLALMLVLVIVWVIYYLASR